jgi:hypothetical protein
MIDQLLDHLYETDGVVAAHVDITVTATVQTERINYRHHHQRVASEHDLREIADTCGWQYRGTVDTVGGYRLHDEFTTTETVNVATDQDAGSAW